MKNKNKKKTTFVSHNDSRWRFIYFTKTEVLKTLRNFVFSDKLSKSVVCWYLFCPRNYHNYHLPICIIRFLKVNSVLRTYVSWVWKFGTAKNRKPLYIGQLSFRRYSVSRWAVIYWELFIYSFFINDIFRKILNEQ